MSKKLVLAAVLSGCTLKGAGIAGLGIASTMAGTGLALTTMDSNQHNAEGAAGALLIVAGLVTTVTGMAIGVRDFAHDDSPPTAPDQAPLDTTPGFYCASNGDGSCWRDDRSCRDAGGGCMRLDEAWCSVDRASAPARRTCGSTRAACDALRTVQRTKSGGDFGACELVGVAAAAER